MMSFDAFICCYDAYVVEQAIEHIVKLPVIWDAMSPMCLIVKDDKSNFDYGGTDKIVIENNSKSIVNYW